MNGYTASLIRKTDKFIGPLRNNPEFDIFEIAVFYTENRKNNEGILFATDKDGYLPAVAVYDEDVVIEVLEKISNTLPRSRKSIDELYLKGSDSFAIVMISEILQR
ncbi:hypothetical protein AB3N59_19620 [Leptospira sp. WS92.C1]